MPNKPQVNVKAGEDITAEQTVAVKSDGMVYNAAEGLVSIGVAKSSASRGDDVTVELQPLLWSATMKSS